MKLYKITILTIAQSMMCLLLFTMVSCKKMLDLKPTDQLDETGIFDSTERLESAVLGAYEGWYPEYSMRIASVLTDECRLGPRNSGVSAAGQNLFRWTYSSADEEILDPWKNGYQVIDRVNRLLNGLPKVPVNNDDDQEKLSHLEGELLAIRAYAHFDLYRLYGASGTYKSSALAVPYMISSSTAHQPVRPTVDTFFQLFWKDITAAERLLTTSGNNIRMNLNAVHALHARAALYTEKYAEAAEYASKVIDKVPLANATDFEAVWKDQSNAEVVFKLKRTNLSHIRPGDLFYNIGAERTLFAPALKLMDSYSEEDVRFTSWFDSDKEREDEGELAETVIKYEGEENAPNRNDVKVFRTGEMYLIRAEAELNNGNLTQASKDLNDLRAARIKDYRPALFGNATQLKVAVAQERYKELPYEGHRYFDLKRRGEGVVRATSDADQNYLTLPQTAVTYLIPIPQGEVQANPNIRPNNPGW